MLQILDHQRFLDRNPILLISLHHAGQVLPSSGRHEKLPFRGILNLVKMLRVRCEIGGDARVDAMGKRIVHPYGQVGFNLHMLYPVKGSHVQLADGLIVFRRVSGSGNDPPVGNGIGSEHFIL